MVEPNEEVLDVEEALELPAEPAEGEEDTTDWKGEAQKLRDKAIAQRERTKTIKKERDDAKKALETFAKVKTPETQPKTGELSEAQQDFFELKGYDDDQVEVFRKIMEKTGMSHREVIKDDYAISKVKAIQAKKEVEGATPSSTKRAGGQVGDVASAAAKFKETGVLPDDKALADAVVDSIAKAGNDRLPPWQR